MSHAEKSAYYQELKGAGITFDKPYRQYTTAELKAAVDKLHELRPVQAAPAPAVPSLVAQVSSLPPAVPTQRPSYLAPAIAVARDELAGVRLNTKDENEPLRTDPDGTVWYQDEIRKSATPKPRARRVLRYVETGSRKQTVQNGEYQETFEVAGDRTTPGEVKITLPSYQVGIYRDPRFPFKIHVYNGNRGFDLFEVQKFYGGAELVPPEVKRVYVENVLCYDIRTTVRAINTEYRERVLGQMKGL